MLAVIIMGSVLLGATLGAGTLAFFVNAEVKKAEMEQDAYDREQER